MKERENSLGAHTSQRKKKRRGTGIAWHFILSTESGAGKRRRQRKSEREGSVSWDCLMVKKGEDAVCKAKLGLKLGGLSGSLPSGYSPTTHCSALLACLLAWLVQDSAPSLKPPPFCLPPDALFHSSLTPSKILPAFGLLYHLSPGAVDLRMREKKHGERK